MKYDFLNDIVNKTESFTIFLSSGNKLRVDSRDVKDFTCEDGIVTIEFYNNRIVCIMDREIEMITAKRKDKKNE